MCHSSYPKKMSLCLFFVHVSILNFAMIYPFVVPWQRSLSKEVTYLLRQTTAKPARMTTKRRIPATTRRPITEVESNGAPMKERCIKDMVYKKQWYFSTMCRKVKQQNKDNTVYQNVLSNNSRYYTSLSQSPFFLPTPSFSLSAHLSAQGLLLFSWSV